MLKAESIREMRGIKAATCDCVFARELDATSAKSRVVRTCAETEPMSAVSVATCEEHLFKSTVENTARKAIICDVRLDTSERSAGSVSYRSVLISSFRPAQTMLIRGFYNTHEQTY